LVREVYRFGHFRLDLPARRLTRSGEPVALPPKAFELLQLLVRNSDRALSRTELLDTVWRDTIVEEGSLGWNMSVLRKALDDTDGTVIETVRRYGYRLALPVELEAEPPSAAALGSEPPESGSGPVEPAPPAAGEAPEAAGGESFGPGEGRAARSGVRRLVLVGAAAIVLVVAVFLAAGRIERGAARRGSGAPGARPALAVLPFENLSARPEDGWLATALAEVLTSELALGGDATTVPGESVARISSDLGFRAGSGLAPATLARLRDRLGLDLVVVGSYLVVGDPETLRVDLRLQDAASGAIRGTWSESGTVDELLALVARTGSELRAELGGGGSGAGAPSGASVAYRAPSGALRSYSEAVELRRRYRLREAREKLEQAVAAAPGFVVARAALADLLSELGYGRQAIEESRRALAGAGDLPAVERLPIEAKNREFESRWSEAAALWSELSRLDPGSLDPALALARSLSRAGRFDEARRLLDELGRRAAPAGTDPRIVLERGWAERYAQRFEEMEEAGLRGAEIGRELPSDYVLAEALSLVGWADLTLGRDEQGLAACTEGEAVAARIGHVRLQTLHLSTCGWIEANRGDGAAARALFERGAAMAEASGDAIYGAGLHTALGWNRFGDHDLVGAEGEVKHALELARQVGDQERIAVALDLESRLLYEEARLDEAESAAVEGVARSRAINISSRLGTMLGHLGRIRRARGDVAGALAAHEEPIGFRSDAAPWRLAPRQLDLARTRLAAGDPQGAIELCDAAEERLAAETKESAQRLDAVAIRGLAGLARGDRDAARAALERLDAPGAELGLELRLDHAALRAGVGDEAGAAGELAALLADPASRGFERIRLTAALRDAELETRLRSGAAATARLQGARSRVRAARLGSLLGEKL